MRKSMRFFRIAWAGAITGSLLLGMAPTAAAQRIRSRVVIVGPGPFYGPFYPFYPYYGYYPYPPYYMAGNYGEVKIETHRKDAQVYIDGGFAAPIKETKKFPLRPVNPTTELPHFEGPTNFRDRVGAHLR